MNLKALLVDDEQHNLYNLQALLEAYCPQVTVCGLAANAPEARALIQQERPGLLFLDIQMPGETGFDLLRSISVSNLEIIFVTAYDHYAIQAMRFAAVDYLLKPVDIEELKQAVDRAASQYEQKLRSSQLDHLMAILKNQTIPSEQRIALPGNKETRLVKTVEIVRCESSNNYTTFYFQNGESQLVSKPIYEYEELLSDFGFIRCHQSHLVNRQYIKSWKREHGDFLIMTSGVEVPVARAKKERVKQLLNLI